MTPHFSKIINVLRPPSYLRVEPCFSTILCILLDNVKNKGITGWGWPSEEKNVVDLNFLKKWHCKEKDVMARSACQICISLENIVECQSGQCNRIGVMFRFAYDIRCDVMACYGNRYILMWIHCKSIVNPNKSLVNPL